MRLHLPQLTLHKKSVWLLTRQLWTRYGFETDDIPGGDSMPMYSPDACVQQPYQDLPPGYLCSSPEYGAFGECPRARRSTQPEVCATQQPHGDVVPHLPHFSPTCTLTSPLLNTSQLESLFDPPLDP